MSEDYLSLKTQFSKVWTAADDIFWENYEGGTETLGDFQLILQTLRSSFQKMTGIRNALFLAIGTSPLLGTVLKTQQLFMVETFREIPAVFFFIASILGVVSSAMGILQENRDIMRVNAEVMLTLDKFEALSGFGLYKDSQEYELMLQNDSIFDENGGLNIVERFYTWKKQEDV